ncbi:MAG: hypothetical protein LBT10_04940, partial [Methanobrevibacter sp.]|nr:hypothetical protein [Methanobrevibacter sp.]
TIEKLKTDDKSLITCTWSKLFLLQIQIPDCEFPSSFYSAVKLAWIFTIEKLKIEDKSLIRCIWSKLFLLQIRIPDWEFPSSFYSTKKIYY